MVVVDASVVCKVVLQEENRDKAKDILKRHVEGLDQVIVPNLLFYEVANTLATKSAIPKTQMIRSFDKLGSLNLTIYNPTLEEMRKAAEFAKDRHASVYDAIYVVVAQENKCDLITADNKFAKQVNLPFVKTLDSLN